MLPNLMEQLKEATSFLKEKFLDIPRLAIVLSSGLADEFLRKVKIVHEISFEKIPYFKKPTVEGHRGILYFGWVQDLPLLIADGRLHYYEGYSLEEVVFSIRVYHQLEVSELILTNVAGGVNPLFKRGDLMLVTDHLNLTGQNPLRGPNEDSLGSRFPDMVDAYSPTLIKKLQEAARRVHLKLYKGVYVGVAGPAYETPAEVKMYRKLGGDAVGMSTVPEVIVANHLNLKTAAISCIANVSLSKKKAEITHEEVIAAAEENQHKLSSLLESYLCVRK